MSEKIIFMISIAMMFVSFERIDDLTSTKYNIKGTAIMRRIMRIFATRLFVQSDRDCRQFCEDTADCRFYYWSAFSFNPLSFLQRTSALCRKSAQIFCIGLNWSLLQVSHRLLSFTPLLLPLPQVPNFLCSQPNHF